MPYDDYDYYDDEQELTLLDVLGVLWRGKYLIIFFTLVFGVFSARHYLSQPDTFMAACRVLSTSSGSRVETVGGTADIVGFSRASSTGQMFIGIMNGRSVREAVAQRLRTLEKYKDNPNVPPNQITLGILGATEDTRSGIITVTCIHTNPIVAADTANILVEELQRKLREISNEDAIQRRAFFENQFIQAQQELSEAEEAIISYQREKGLIAFESQTQALVSSMNTLKSQIAAKNVEISALSSYARRDNPRVRLAQSQLDAMTKELRRLEEETKAADLSSIGKILSGDISLSINMIPELGIEYQHYVRTLQFASAKYELMLRQYENARLSEANDLSIIFMLDPALPPTFPYNSSNKMMIYVVAAVGAFIGAFISFFIAHIQMLLARRREKRKYED